MEQQQHELAVVVEPAAADAPDHQPGDVEPAAADAPVHQPGDVEPAAADGPDHQPGDVEPAAADAPQPEDVEPVQNIRLVIDIGDGRTIEIPLKGHLVLQNSGASPQAAAATAAGGDDSVESDREYLKNMRGWLMTVATLFVGIAFQATLHPPGWMSTSNDIVEIQSKDNSSRAAPSPSPSPAATQQASDTITPWCTAVYRGSNMATFAIGIALVVTLLLMKKPPPKHTILASTFMVCLLAFTVTTTFVVAASEFIGLDLFFFGSAIAGCAYWLFLLIIIVIKACLRAFGRLLDVFARYTGTYEAGPAPAS